MSLKFLLIIIFSILINVAASGFNFHLYLLNGEPANMICGFVSAALAILLIIQLGKEL